MKNTKLVLILCLTTFSLHSLLGQTSDVDPKFYNWFDNKVGRYNTSLFNGVEYVELYRTINDRHKFFGSSDFQIGSLIYDGQFYDQVPLKYDLDADNLLLNVGYNYPYPILILIKNKIDAFSLQGADFIRLPEENTDLDETGFYQVLLKNNTLSLLKKNNKKRFKRIRGSTLYYEFTLEGSYALQYGGNYYEISNKQDIVRIWPDHKEFINENYNTSLKKSDEDAFWIGFFSKLSDVVNTKI